MFGKYFFFCHFFFVLTTNENEWTRTYKTIRSHSNLVRLKLRITPTRGAVIRKIIQHQSTFVIGNPVNHLCIYDNSIKCNQVGNEETDLLFFVPNSKRGLLADGNVFVWFLDQAY
jgi:hypothetical protein